MKFRPNVAAVILNQRGDKILMFHRVDGRRKGWQFPQGGVDPGETEEQAMLRELNEEIGTNDVKILKQSSKRTQKGKDSLDMDSTGGARNSRKKQKAGPGPQSLGKSKHPKTLALSKEKEEANLNQLHQFVRKDLVSELFALSISTFYLVWYQYQLT